MRRSKWQNRGEAGAKVAAAGEEPISECHACERGRQWLDFGWAQCGHLFKWLCARVCGVYGVCVYVCARALARACVVCGVDEAPHLLGRGEAMRQS